MPTTPPLEAAVGRLADLAIVGGNAGGADHHATLAGGFGFVLAHGVSRQADHVEAAHQVDHDGLGVDRQAVRAVLAHGLFGRRDAGTVDQAHELAQGNRLGHHGLAVGFIADVALQERAADLPGDGLPFSTCMSAITTVAPLAASMRAVPSPRPEAPPVTMKTLP
jgi:hypothetical protein